MSLKDSPSFAAYMYRFARGLKCAGHSAEDVYFDLWERFDKGHDIADELVTEIGACLNAGERDHVIDMLRPLLKSEQALLGMGIATPDMNENKRLRAGLEKIASVQMDWEKQQRNSPPWWNLGDIARSALGIKYPSAPIESQAAKTPAPADTEAA